MRWVIIVVSCFLSSINLTLGADATEESWTLHLPGLLPRTERISYYGYPPYFPCVDGCDCIYPIDVNPFEGSMSVVFRYPGSAEKDCSGIWVLSLVSSIYKSEQLTLKFGKKDKSYGKLMSICNEAGVEVDPILHMTHLTDGCNITIELDLTDLRVGRTFQLDRSNVEWSLNVDREKIGVG